MYEEDAVVEALVPSTVQSGQGGQVITVIGRHFMQNRELSCLFGRDSRVAVLQQVSSTIVVCAVPGRIAGTVTVSVSNSGVGMGAAGKPLVVGLHRRLVALTPSRGPVQGGSLVMIEVAGGVSSGEKFVTCVFGGRRVRGHVQDGKAVECVATKVNSAGKVKVELEGLSGLTGQLDFEYYFAPSIHRLVPSHGALGGGNMVTLHGSGFSEEGLRCRFGSGVAGEGKGRRVSSSIVSCRAPSMVETRTVIVEVSFNDGADYGPEGVEYVYEMGATVDSVHPSRGVAGALGQVVTVLGKHFVKTADLRCFFGLNAGVVGEYVSSSLVTCEAKRQIAGMVSVGVGNNGMDDRSGSGRFVFRLERSLVAIVPSAGPVEGGARVLLKLEGIWDESETISIRFGAVVSIAEVINNTYAQVIVPRTTSIGSVTVDSQEGTVQGGMLFTYYESPKVLALWPTRGPIAGGTLVSVKGSNMVKSAIQCQFGRGPSLVVKARWVSSSLAECTSPARLGEGLVSVEVSFSDGVVFATSQVGFMYDNSVVMEALRPPRGTADVLGQVVTVIGQHFKQSPELSCHFGLNQVVLAEYISATLLVCSVPARGHGTVSLVVSNNGVDVPGETLRYEFGVAKSIAGITPSSGPSKGGTMISVEGLGIESEYGQYMCSYGTGSAVGQFVRSNLIVCQSPIGTMAGSFVNVTLTVDRELVSGSHKFEIYEDPRVLGLVPSVGSVSGGTFVSVLGSRFGRTGLQCRFGSQRVSGSGARLVSSTVVACRIPPGKLGERVLVEISLNGGFDFSADGREFLYGRGVTVELARPSQALAGLSGQTITIVGQHFEKTRELRCKFGQNATQFGFFMTSTLVTCLVPNRGTGTASIVLSNDGYFYEGPGLNLEFIGAGGVLSVYPSYGAMSGGNEVTVKGSKLDLFNASLHCTFGFISTPARLRGKNELVCSVPGSETPGDVQMNLVHMGINVPGSVVYRYLEDSEVWSLFPSQGQLTGETLVSVIGTRFVGGGVHCKFGTRIVQSAGVLLSSSTLVLCTSPAAKEEGRVAVEISVDDGMRYTRDGMQFIYELGARAENVQPSVVKSETAGQQVTVFGHNFRQNAGLSCMFV